MPLPTMGGTIREARSGNVHEANRAEEGGREARDGGVVDTLLENQKEKEKGRRG